MALLLVLFVFMPATFIGGLIFGKIAYLLLSIGLTAYAGFSFGQHCLLEDLREAEDVRYKRLLAQGVALYPRKTSEQVQRLQAPELVHPKQLK